MKRILSIVAAFLIVSSVSAKKVKFAVDMGTNTINASGVHLIGDFQVMAGFGTIDWDPSTTQLMQEGTSTIYSIIVNIPAFQKYEFKFVNGIQTYEAEFVPEESRVGYNFDDNRWLYVDSLANDTTYAGAVLFGGNAPMGKSLVRFKVDLSTSGTISSNGVHLGTSYQSYSPTKTRLYSFGNAVYEVINYVTNASYDYIYFNGNQAATTETVPGTCATSGKRPLVVTKDTVLTAYCFSGCVACIGAGIKQNYKDVSSLIVYPNPATENVTAKMTSSEKHTISVIDNLGRVVYSIPATASTQAVINVRGFAPGIYSVVVKGEKGSIQVKKLVVE